MGAIVNGLGLEDSQIRGAATPILGSARSASGSKTVGLGGVSETILNLPAPEGLGFGANERHRAAMV